MGVGGGVCVCFRAHIRACDVQACVTTHTHIEREKASVFMKEELH